MHHKYKLSMGRCQETFGNFFERNIAKAKLQQSVALSDLLFITATYCRSFLLLKQKKDRPACADSGLSIPPFLVQRVIYKISFFYLCAHYGKINEANVVAGSLLTDITEPKVFYGNSLQF